MVTKSLTSYFNGDTLASDVWLDKYCMKDKDKNPLEQDPDDSLLRNAREFARKEFEYIEQERSISPQGFSDLSSFGQDLMIKRYGQTEQDIVEEFFGYMAGFNGIIPQGSVLSNLGNPHVFGSLSNCFGIGSPIDSYGGIFKTDQEIAQLQKRRGGVGTTLDNLRPEEAYVSNNAGSSTGVSSFMERYSNTTREVAQNGRRGALMLLLHVKHPSIFKFVTVKDDRTKVTGANVSAKLTNEFMVAALNKEDFICTFPIDVPVTDGIKLVADNLPYNQMCPTDTKAKYIMKIKAVELLDIIAEMACKNAEPGVAFIDTIIDYSPDGVYEMYMPRVCNPCGEQWFSFDETCRLITNNYFKMVVDPFTFDAHIDFDRLYEYAYIQQRMGDNLVDLEIEKIDGIINKIKKDPEDEETKRVELQLWQRIRQKAIDGRRTGNGFTGFGDMLAALNVPYGSDKALMVTEAVMQCKMMAELDATIDMAITRGTFTGWNRDLEYGGALGEGKNSFFSMIREEFDEQCERMYQWGRRNVSWSTLAPNGTTSLMGQVSSGMEPAFNVFHIRKRKINPDSVGITVDFVDQSGDKWQEYPVLHPKFKDWCDLYGYSYETKEQVKRARANSPWFGSEADDINPEMRIKMQAVLQKYTTNAISSTINLPKETTPETIRDIYVNAWKHGLKGVTVYRDGSRTGVLTTESSKITTKDEFGYNKAIKRPEELEAEHFSVIANGINYSVIVGLMNSNPYEIFAFADSLLTENTKGKIVKIGKNRYSYRSDRYIIENLRANTPEENLLTRWVSLSLRHGADPKYLIEQVDKSGVAITTFAKAVSRVLGRYVKHEHTKELCSNCNEPTIIYEEGCKKCTSCGSSKC